MSKTGRIVLKFFSGFVLLALLAVLILPKLINPNNYKSLIENSVHDATGFYFKISGPIEWQIFPSLALNLRDIQLSADEQHTKPLVQVKTAAINLALKPLFSKQLLFNEIELNKPEINVIPELLVPNVAGEPSVRHGSASKSPREVNKSASSSAIQVDIKKMSLSEGHITFWNHQQKSFALSDIELETSQFSTGEKTPVSLSAHFVEQANALSGRFKLEAAVQLGKPLWNITEMTGELTIDKAAILDKPLTGKLLIPTLEFNQQTQAFNLPQMKVSLDGQDALTGSIISQRAHDKLELAGKLNLAHFDARSLMAKFYPKMIKKLPRNAYKKINLSVVINANEEQLSLTDIKANLDTSQLEGALLYFSGGDQPRLDIDIDIDQIDIDKYWIPSESPVEKPTKPPLTENTTGFSVSQGADAERASEKSLTEKLKLSAEFKINRLKFMNLVFGRVYGKARSANGRYQLNPVSALMYEGQYRSSSVIDLNQQPATWQSEQSLKNINVRDFFNDFNKTNIFSGYATVNAHLAGRLAGAEQFMQHLSGTTQFSLINGYYEGADLSYLWSQARQFFGAG